MTDAPPRRLRLGSAGILVGAGIVLLSLNLRPAAVSVGPVLAEVQAGLGMSSSEAGLLTSLPVLAFAGFGALTPRIAARVGVHRTAFMAIVALCAGLAGRAVTTNDVVFLLLSAFALAGMAVANVLLPSLVKRHFPDRVGPATAVYTTALAIGLTGSLLLTVPVAHALGSWRWGLGVWAVLGVIAMVPWFRLLAHDNRSAAKSRRISVVEVARTRLGRSMMLFFGLQSMQAYVAFGWYAQLWRDAGYSPAAAGALVALLAAVSVPLSLIIPAAAARRGDQRRLGYALIACYPAGFAMLLFAPRALAIPAALAIGVGCCVFPLALTLIGLRSRTPAGTAALSSFSQSGGYLLASLGPLGIGLLHDATHGWTVPLIVLAAASLPMFWLMSYVGRPLTVEDQLR